MEEKSLPLLLKDVRPRFGEKTRGIRGIEDRLGCDGEP